AETGGVGARDQQGKGETTQISIHKTSERKLFFMVSVGRRALGRPPDSPPTRVALRRRPPARTRRVSLVAIVLKRRRLPDVFGVFAYRPVAGELADVRDVQDRAPRPRLLIAIK